MTTNDYNSYAERRAQEFASGKNLFHAYTEKPAMFSVLPSVVDMDVLSVGCGTGEECLELQTRGANVSGFDLSEASVEQAKKHVPPEVNLWVQDMDDPAAFTDLEADRFGLVYSSMSLHYSNDIANVFRGIHRVLKPEGSLLFSVVHPLHWAGERREFKQGHAVQMGFEFVEGELTLHGDYLNEQQNTRQLLDGPRITYWIRPPSDYFRLLKQTGFVVNEFLEPKPVPELEQLDKTLWDLRSTMPNCMIFSAQKK